MPSTASRPLPSPRTGLPRLPASPFQRAVPITPMNWNGCIRRLLPRPRGLPRYSGGSASAPSLSRPAQALLKLRPAGLLNRPRRHLSRGFGPTGYPAKPLVSYQTYRQLSGWNLPPLVLRAFGAHVESRTGAVAMPRFPSPLIKPDVPISGIRLSDWLHRTAIGGGPMCTRRRRRTPPSP